MSASSVTTSREIDDMKASFHYQSYRRDLDYLLDDLDRGIFSDEYLQGRSIFTVASELVIDAYYERGTLEPLVKIYTSQPYRIRARFDKLLCALEEQGRTDLIETFWLNIASVTRNEYRYQHSGQLPGDLAPVSEYKKHVVDCHEDGIDHCNRIGLQSVAQKLAHELDRVENDNSASLAPPSESRQMDEKIFWDIIGQSRQSSADPTSQVVNIADQLIAFKSAEIRRFIALYVKQMKQLYHWNVWALAYGARGGCSDTAFEQFRTWLILQGGPQLLSTARTKPQEAAVSVPADPMLPKENMVLVLLDAYTRRAGTAMEIPSMESDAPKGKFWEESDYYRRFPALAHHYDRLPSKE